MSSMTQIKYLNINQVKRERIPINSLPFSSRVSLDANCIFAWLIILFPHMFLSLLLNEFLQLCIIQKSRSVQDITSIIAAADELSGALLDFVIQINNFFSFIQFSANNLQKRRKETDSQKT